MKNVLEMTAGEAHDKTESAARGDLLAGNTVETAPSESPMHRMRVLLIDDHALFREGIRLLLDQVELDCCVLQAGSCTQGIALMEQCADLDLVLLDLGLPDMDGMEALLTLRERFPAVKVVVLSGFEDRALALEAVSRGAMGFIGKSFSSETLLDALRLVFRGGIYLPQALIEKGGTSLPMSSPHQASAPKTDDRPSCGLTPRQLEVLELVAQGSPNKVIARQLKLSPATVKTHIAACMRALKAKNRTEAAWAFSRLG
jgi:DNA-binding NarL/FixJ family response regulator